MFDSDPETRGYNAVLAGASLASLDWEQQVLVDDYVVSPVDLAFHSLVREGTRKSAISKIKGQTTIAELKTIASDEFESMLRVQASELFASGQLALQNLVMYASDPVADDPQTQQLSFQLEGDFAPSKKLVSYWVRGVEALAREAKVIPAENASTKIDVDLQQKFAEELVSLLGTIAQQLRHEESPDMEITKSGRFGLLYQMQLSDQFFIIPDEASAFFADLRDELILAVASGTSIEGVWGAIRVNSTGDLCYSLHPAGIVVNQSFVRAEEVE